MAFEFESRPNRIPWPPLIVAAALAIATLGAIFFPVRTGLGAPGRGLGWALIALGLTLDVSAIATLARARTNVLPHRAADRLVTHGPFAFTRNPIYLGNAIALAGLGGAVNSAWFVVASIIAALMVDILAIRREEAHLALRFGAQWRDYAARTPRWLPAPAAFRRGRGAGAR